jgi:hypothetical protein
VYQQPTIVTMLPLNEYELCCRTLAITKGSRGGVCVRVKNLKLCHCTECWPHFPHRAVVYNLTNGIEYALSITCCNVRFCSAPSTPTLFSPSSVGAAAGPVLQLSAGLTSQLQPELRWIPPVLTGSPAVTSYSVNIQTLDGSLVEFGTTNTTKYLSRKCLT